MEFEPGYSESLIVHFRRIETLKEEALEYPFITLNKRQLCDPELLLNRAFYPLRGYQNRPEYESILETMRLPDGTVWPMPLCLDLLEDQAHSLQQGQPVSLCDEEGFLLALLHVSDAWTSDKQLGAGHLSSVAEGEGGCPRKKVR